MIATRKLRGLSRDDSVTQGPSGGNHLLCSHEWMPGEWHAKLREGRAVPRDRQQMQGHVSTWPSRKPCSVPLKPIWVLHVQEHGSH